MSTQLPTVERKTYTVTEAAEILGISPASAYKSVHSGEIPSLTFGGRIVVPRRALDALLALEEPT